MIFSPYFQYHFFYIKFGRQAFISIIDYSHIDYYYQSFSEIKILSLIEIIIRNLIKMLTRVGGNNNDVSPEGKIYNSIGIFIYVTLKYSQHFLSFQTIKQVWQQFVST